MNFHWDFPHFPLLEIIDKEHNFEGNYQLTPESEISMKIYTDKKYCECGEMLTSSGIEDNLDWESEASLKNKCISCAKKNPIHVCKIHGVPSFRRNATNQIDCNPCYRYSLECSSGFCLYLCILNEHPLEVKVGLASLDNFEKRAMKGGYAAAAILVPQNENMISLPVADYIEKRILDGIIINLNSNHIRVNQRFFKDIGFVGNDIVLKNTFECFKTFPSNNLEKLMDRISSLVLDKANLRIKNDYSAKRYGLPLLEVVDLKLYDYGELIDFDFINKLDTSIIKKLSSSKYKSRRAIELQGCIKSLKGNTIILEDNGNHYCYKLRNSIINRREFESSSISKQLGLEEFL